MVAGYAWDFATIVDFVARSVRSMPLVAALLCGVTIAGCGGGGSPSVTVASIAGSPITEATVNHWIGIAVNSTNPTAGAKRQPTPIPPDFTACIAFSRANNPKPAGGAPTTTASLRAGCRLAYAAALKQVMFFLITAAWLEGETAREGIRVSPSAVEAQLARSEAATVAQGQIPSLTALTRYLSSIGETHQDESLRMKISMLSSELSRKALGTAPKVTAGEIAAYYRANRSKLGTPETRDLGIVLVKKVASAKRVVALIRAGAGFSEVARQFSIDAYSRSKGGVLAAQRLTGSVLGASLAAAVFHAPPHALEGPIHTTHGYVVFRVQKITPATRPSLFQASAKIASALTAARAKALAGAFTSRVDAKWLKLTTCRPGFAVATTPAVCGDIVATTPNAAGTTSTAGVTR